MEFHIFIQQIKLIQPSGKTYTVSTISGTESTDITDATIKGREVCFFSEFMKQLLMHVVNIIYTWVYCLYIYRERIKIT